MWQDWEYEESQAMAPAEQVEAMQQLQTDSGPMTAEARGTSTELPSNTMTEEERRAFQQDLADRMQARAEAQREAAREHDEKARAAQQQAGGEDRGS